MIRSDYLKEFATNWRLMLGAILGLGSGFTFTNFTAAIFAAPMIAELGWSKSQFALVGMLSLLSLVIMPIAGRSVDVFGVRKVVLPGLIVVSLCYVAFSVMTGNFVTYLAIFAVQMIFGIFTTSVAYTRAVADNFVCARGLALALLMCGPALTSAVGAPLITAYMEANGWREAYRLVAGATLAMGLAGYWLMSTVPTPERIKRERAKRSWADYRSILGAKAFWVIFGGLALCNIAGAMHGAQLQLMLLDRGLTMSFAAMMVSTFAIGVVVGRLLSGVALDRLPAEFVAVAAMALPSVGLLLLGLGVSAPVAVTVSVLFMGLSQGAENDIGGFLTMKYFGVGTYGTVYGLLLANNGPANAIGAVVLSMSLALTNSYTFFLLFGAGLTVAGSSVFLLLKLRAVHENAPAFRSSQGNLAETRPDLGAAH